MQIGLIRISAHNCQCKLVGSKGGLYAKRLKHRGISQASGWRCGWRTDKKDNKPKELRWLLLYFFSVAVGTTDRHQKDKRYWKLALFCQLLCQSCNQKSNPLLILTRWCRVVAQGATTAGQSNVECDFSSPHCCSAGNSDAVAHSGGCCHQIVGRDNKLRKANNILIFAGNCRRHRMKEFRTECSNIDSRVFSRLASQCMVGPNKLSGEDKQIGIIKPHNRQIKNLHALPKPTEIEQFAALPLLVPGFRGGSISHLLCYISLRPFVHFVWHAKRRCLFPVWYLAVISFRWELAELN